MPRSLESQKSTVWWNDGGKSQTGVGERVEEELVTKSIINYFKEFAARGNKETGQAIGRTGVKRRVCLFFN